MKTFVITCGDAQARAIQAFIDIANRCRDEHDPAVMVQELDVEKYARYLIQDWVITRTSNNE